MLHGKNPTHTTKQCRTLKKEAEKHKKGRENCNRKNKKHKYNPSKEEIHVLNAFAKEQLKAQCKNVDKELQKFENLSMSSNKAGK